MMFQAGTSAHGTFSNEPMVLIGDPINPFAIIELYISLLQLPEHSRIRGGFLVANPQGNQMTMEKLRQLNWTKLPTISMPVDPLDYGFVWGDRYAYRGSEEFGNRSWNEPWSDNVHRNVRDHEHNQYYGRFMGLEQHEERKSSSKAPNGRYTVIPNSQIYLMKTRISSSCDSTSSFLKYTLRYVKMNRSGNVAYSLVGQTS